MDSMDRMEHIRYKMLVSEYDRMLTQLNDPNFNYYDLTDKKFLRFKEFKNSCSSIIESFEEKVAFMLQFDEIYKKEEKQEQIKILKETRENLINEARNRYNNKSRLWKFTHRASNPQNINFSNLSDSEICELYNDSNVKKGK